MTAPDSTPLVVTSPNFVRILSTSKGDQSVATAPSATQTISAQFGGTVSNGRVTLDFPAGALDQDTQITIEMLTDGTLGVELSPHGLQFNKPVTMTMNLAGTTAEGRGWETDTLWWNDKMEQYERMEKVYLGDDYNSAHLLHFSKYHSDING